MIGFSLRLAVCTGVVWLVLKLLLGIDNPDSFFYVAVLDLVLPACGALSAFVLCSYVLRIEEFKAAVNLVRYRKAAVSALYGEAK
ncbi:MAG: hypothetical protein ACYTBJ_20865 [Planctomycetota bacterium]|jgi:hypothetical protein